LSVKFSATLLVLWLSTQTVIFLLAEASEEYFSSHTSSSFIIQYVGVIFNHNIRKGIFDWKLALEHLRSHELSVEHIDATLTFNCRCN